MNRWVDRANKCISQGSLTNSKHPRMLIEGLFPSHIKGAHGCYLYDTNDKKHVDFICGLGTNLLGYGNDFINQKIIKELYNGFSHSLPTTFEVETAESLQEMFPEMKLWKFLKTGTEACMAALRIARAMTGRNLVLSHGYHGWSDQFVGMLPNAKGVCGSCNMRELQTIEQVTKDVAAVIIEPVITDYSPERIEWLRDLRNRCTETGTVLIFDEVITGFRFKKGSVTEYAGIDPDLICIGKAMAGGLPLAAVGGKHDLMEDSKWFVSSTYAGEILSLVACKEVIRLLNHNSSYDINHLWSEGEKFLQEFNSFSTNLKIEGYPTRGVFKGSEKTIALFMQEMAKAEILFCKSWFYNFPLIETNTFVLESAKIVLDKIDRGSVQLNYPMPRSPFSMGVRK